MKRKLKLEGKNMLSKVQLREIRGGYDLCGDPSLCDPEVGYWFTITNCSDLLGCIGCVAYSCTYVPGYQWHQ